MLVRSPQPVISRLQIAIPPIFIVVGAAVVQIQASVELVLCKPRALVGGESVEIIGPCCNTSEHQSHTLAAFVRNER